VEQNGSRRLIPDLPLTNFMKKSEAWSGLGPVSIAEPVLADIGMGCCLWLGLGHKCIVKLRASVSSTWTPKEMGEERSPKGKKAPKDFSKGKLERWGGAGTVVTRSR